MTACSAPRFPGWDAEPCGYNARGGRKVAGIREMMLSPCASASSMTASSRSRSAAPSAGIATSPSAWPADGHEVTYLTLRQWDRGAAPGVDGRCGSSRWARGWRCTRGSGRRRILPPLVFGLGVFWHLLRHGRRYDVVHTCAFPYFSLLAAAAAAAAAALRAGRRLVRGLEPLLLARLSRRPAGAIGALVQRACAAVPQRAFCFSELHAARLRAEGLRGELIVLRGLYAGSLRAGAVARGGEPVVVFAGRLIPEKRVDARRGRGGAAAAAADRGPAGRVLRRRARARAAARGDRRARR